MKNKTVPEIRYKNIEDEWNLIKLSDLMNFSNGINAPKESYGRGRKMISVMDILSEERIEYKKIRNSVEVKESIESKNKVENGDLIFVRSSEVRNEVGWAKAYLQEQYALHSGFTIRGKKQNEYDAKFIECSLNFRNRHQIESKAGGSTRYNVGQEILKNVEIYIPPLKEQLLISTLIQNIENKINLHQQELDALKQTKQGFLQKMFPKDQELIPKMRLSGFEGKWIEMKFKNLAKIRRGLTYKPKDVDKSGIRVLRSSNIKGDSFILKDDDVFVKQEVVNINYAKENEILITSANGSSNLVGKHALIKKLNSPTVHGGFMLIASAKTPYFVNTLMNTEWYDRFIKIHVSGGNGAIGNLNKNSLENYSVMVPSIEEQVKIGEFFRQLDEVIELKEQELEALKQTKKGFLQKMFV